MSYFDSKAKDYDETKEQHEQAQIYFDNIIEAINDKPLATVLDYGCGTGILAMHFVGKMNYLIGFDSSTGMLDIFKKKLVDNNIVNMLPEMHNADWDNMQENAFDLIYSTKTLHHIKNTKDFLKQCFTALKKDGHLCIIDLETEDGTFHKEMNPGIKHLGFDKDYIYDLYKEQGFLDISVETVYTIKREVQGVVKDFPMFLAVGKK